MLNELNNSTFEGFVLTAHIHQFRQEIWYGPNHNPAIPFNHANILTTRLNLFPNQMEAMLSYPELKARKSFDKVGLGELKLRTVPNERAEELRGEPKVIIVVELDMGVSFMGKGVEGVHGVAYAPCSNLLLNGVEPFTDFDLAYYAAIEAQRQGHTPVCLASFDFERIKIGQSEEQEK